MKKQKSDGLETIIEQAIAGMPEVKKWQRVFIGILFRTILLIQGRVNFTTLASHSGLHRKTFRRGFQQAFNFERFNANCIEQRPVKGRLLACIDASFIRKSGKYTPGLGHFYNGCAKKSENGLEISEIALIDCESKRAYTLSTKQTLDKAGQTRFDFYADHLKNTVDYLPLELKHLVADGAYSKKNFVDTVCGLGLEMVGKLRSDADLEYLYKGKQLPKGRHRKYDGKVYFDDLSRFVYEGEVDKDLHVFAQTLKHKTLKRIIRVVLLLNTTKKDKPTYILLFSTDLTLSGTEILELYKLRFQIEFLFRDAKQFTGLLHCQARNLKALDFHFNASMSAVNLAKLNLLINHHEQKQLQPGTPDFVFSLAVYKHRNFSQALLKRLLSNLDLTLTSNKIFSAFQHSLRFGISES